MFSLTDFLKISGYISLVINLLIGTFVYSRNKNNPINKFFCLFSFTIAFWSVGSSLVNTITDRATAILVLRFCYLFGVFLPPVYLNFIYFVTAKIKNKTKILFGAYLISLILLPFVFTPFFIKNLKVVGAYGFLISNPAVMYYIFIVFFGCGTYLGLFTLYKAIKESIGTRHNQLKYMFLSQLFALLAGYEYFSSVLGIKHSPPFDDYILSIYFIIMAYSILKYRLMDIRLVLTRGAILLLVYLVIAGVPFLLMFTARPILTLWLHQRWFYPPLALYAVLALLAPYFYLQLQEKAEQRRMLEQRQLHQSLKAASKTTIEVQSMDKLSRIIPRYLIALYGKLNNKITHISLFLLDKGKKTYILKSSAGERKLSEKTSITTDSVLIKWFTETRNILVENSVLKEKEVEVLVYEDIDFWLSKPTMLRVPFKGIDKALRQLKELMESLKAQVILPSVYQEELLGFLVLGEKSPDAYSVSDIDTFSILANDSAMAFKAAELFEELKATQAHLIQSEKLNILGQLASSMAHEINNPLAIISGNVQLLLMKEKDEDKRKLLKKINDQTERGYQIIHRLLNFSRLPKEETKDININEIIDETLELLNHKIVHSNIQLERNYKTIPKIRGNPTQIQEVFLNLFVNAIQAMPQGGRITISTAHNDTMIGVEVADTGKGIAEEDIGNIFNPFFTKGKEEGTGLGLFVADQVMKLHKGNISAKSKVGEGTSFTLKLPLAA